MNEKTLEKMIPFLSDYLPEDLAKKGLMQVSKKMGQFMTQATAGGLGINEILKFLRSKVQEGSVDPRSRPDEQAASRSGAPDSSALRPDEEAEQEIGRQEAGTKSLIKGAVGLGLAAIPTLAAGRAGATALRAGGEIINQAMGGEEEVAPQGEDIEVQATEEIQEGLPGQQAPGQQAPQAGPQDLFRQNPELFTFVDQIIKQGKPPSFAAQRAMRDRRFAQLIPQIEQTAQMDFTSLLEQMYGGQGQQQAQPGQQPGQPQQPQQGGQGGIREQFLQGMQQSDATLNAILQNLQGR